MLVSSACSTAATSRSVVSLGSISLGISNRINIWILMFVLLFVVGAGPEGPQVDQEAPLTVGLVLGLRVDLRSVPPRDRYTAHPCPTY